MSTAAELAAVRGVARQLGQATSPVEVRRARAWSSVLPSAARNLGRHLEFARAEANRTLPPVDPLDETGYDGLDAGEAAIRFAGAVATLAGQGARAGEFFVERERFVRHVDALNAARSTPTGRGVARRSPDASGAGLAPLDGRATAKVAALRALPASGRNRRKVLDAVASVARDPKLVGLTDLQIAEVTGLRDNSVRPRRVELVDGGWLQAATSSDGTPVTREHYGRAHTVWVLTQRAAGEPGLLASLGRA